MHGVLLSNVLTFVSPFIPILLFLWGIGKACIVPTFQMRKPKDLVTLPNNAGSVTAFLLGSRYCCRHLHVLTNFIITTTLSYMHNLLKIAKPVSSGLEYEPRQHTHELELLNTYILM